MPTSGHSEGTLVDAIEIAMSAAAASMKPHKDGTLIALEDAVQDAHDHVRGMPAESEWQAIYFGGGLRRV
jgi:hypothetical protein